MTLDVRPGAKWDVVERAEEIVAKDQAVIKEKGIGDWHKSGEIPKEYRTSTGPSAGSWKNTNKCNRFLQVADPDVPQTTISRIAEKMPHLEGSQVAPGNKLLFVRSQATQTTGATGHGMILGRKGALLHASSVQRGATQMAGFRRVLYKLFWYPGKVPIFVP